MSAYLPGMGCFLSFPANPGPETHRVIPVYSPEQPASSGLASYGGEANAIHLAGSMGNGPVRLEDGRGNVVRWIGGEPRGERFVRVVPV